MRDHHPRTEARGLQLELEGKVSVSNREPGWNRLNQSEALSGNTLSARTKKSRGGNSSGDSEERKGGREIEGRKEGGRESSMNGTGLTTQRANKSSNLSSWISTR